MCYVKVPKFVNYLNAKNKVIYISCPKKRKPKVINSFDSGFL